MADSEEITGVIETPKDMAAPITKSTQFQLAKEWFSRQRQSLKPWGEFVNTGKFSKPKSAAELGRRVMKNLEVYQSNYTLVVLLLTVYCVVTTPLLLVAISVAGGGCWYLTYKMEGKKIKMFGREFSVIEQYGIIALLCLPLLFLASAGSAVFWIIGASVFIILLHASFLDTSSPDSNVFELEMEPV
ncbi:prenylated Rab acceptor protein 1 [Nematostella vectensis]|uniref:prenylated Rab acceptor protein 1 n=1 Tax=Nematostella vectensis TaxID=45351 RepID=UPI00138FC75F|nr:prenylated Rab acceptor protein 1 [Nematostella vectensis]